ncbi:MAG TPA: protein kinase, partial [Planctomycetota bacterium]|nr:protein kinase [Planctomycetota bacterium]
MERGREVLVGKLAIGRRLLAREDAVRCFHQSGKEPFWELAIREGLLERAQADDLVRTVESGSLICRGKCGAVTPLDLDAPPASDRCPRCGGPIYVTSRNAAASRETWKDAGSDELKEAIAASHAAPSTNGPKASAAPGSAGRPPDLRELALTLPPQRPGPVLSSKGSDSLPSAVPIPDPRKKTSAIEVPVPEDEAKSETKSEGIRKDEFQPFTMGTYEVLAPIGKGGMGSVFRARHKALNRIVAIKIFTSHAATDPEQAARFDREIKTMAKLNHPGIVHVQGGGIANVKAFENRPFYVMEYVQGRDLTAW